MTTGCASRRLVDRHFAGSIGAADEHALRTHLPGCDACRERYERHLVLAQFDRSIAPAKQRLARGLGLPPPRSRRWLPIAAGLIAAAAALAIVVHMPAEFQPRGGVVDADQALDIYRIGSDGAPRPVLDGAIRVGDELAFAYRNRRGWAHLMVFAIDPAGRVYWYHPAWTDARTSPTALMIEGGDARHEIPEAVSHRFAPGTLSLHALFSDDALDVRAIEAGSRPDRREELVIALDVVP